VGQVDPSDDIEVAMSSCSPTSRRSKRPSRIEKEVKGKKTERAVLDAVLAAQKLEAAPRCSWCRGAGMTSLLRDAHHDRKAIHLAFQRRRGRAHRYRPPGRTPLWRRIDSAFLNASSKPSC
jgi:hypothetical protein